VYVCVAKCALYLQTGSELEAICAWRSSGAGLD
jgi:hypothetical protein